MSTGTCREGDQPIAGYELCEYLGRGGFGEVWRATGPGGVQVAFKVIRDLDRKKGGKELQALRMLKDIRHPHLVPLTGFWLKGRDGGLISDELIRQSDHETSGMARSDLARGTLIPQVDYTTSSLATIFDVAELLVAMGLCEKSLFNRLEECQASGLEGVPRPELLTYMEDSARAIDLLNLKYHIQHCDIKPQNILLLNGAAQVCDFGLAKIVGDVRESSMGAGTIAYGAPEVLVGKGPTGTTDQYSLAISYFELRTSQLPFGSERVSDVLRAKQHGTIDLSLLEPGEQRVIARAASAEPAQRYPSCREMIDALRAAASEDAQLAGKNCPRESRRARAAGKSGSQRHGIQVRPDGRSMRLLSKLVLPASAAALVILAGVAFVAARSSHKSRSSGREVPMKIAARNSSTERDPEIKPATEDNSKVNATIASAEKTAPVVLAEPAKDHTQATAEMTTRELSKPDANSIHTIRDQFIGALDRSGPISDPTTPGDYYHNARLYEQIGELENAGRSYHALVEFQLNFVDPHLRYQRLLVLQGGHAAARKVYAELATVKADMATKFAAILVEPDDVRVNRLLDFSIAHPKFVPVIYELSREYSAQRLGAQGLADMAYEKDLLEQFEWWVEQGALPQYYLDPEEPEKMIDESRVRLAAFRRLDPEMFKKPVRVSTKMTNDGWCINLAVAEATREIRFRLDGSDEFQSTGHLDFVDPRTGSPAPKPFFEMPGTVTSIKFAVTYTDIRGNEQGPFEFELEPAAERPGNKLRHPKADAGSKLE